MTTVVADASPQKDLFVFTLTKDLSLLRAILDLVDNCVDGAKRLRRETADQRYGGLFVRIQVSPTEFKVTDNCGGIPFDIAKDYAFRFGRPQGMPTTEHGIGQFGVGMKRSLFKLGNQFRVESRTAPITFVISSYVPTWLTTQDWTFPITEIVTHSPPKPVDECGTTITVTELHPTFAQEFGDLLFTARLKSEIEKAHQLILSAGLSITINSVPVTVDLAQLLNSDAIKPVRVHREIGPSPQYPHKISVDIYAGIDKSDPKDAGWYVFCNGRQVLTADTHDTTGWGSTNIPKFHNQFARFRGYVFFDCDDAKLLPWNTTKTGVDEDSGIYRAMLMEMVTVMRPIIDFLNQLDKETEVDEEDRNLNMAVNAARPQQLNLLEASERFVSPEASVPTRKVRPADSVHITYYAKKDLFEKAKTALGAQTNRDVGERTFAYFLKSEGL